MPNSEVAEQEKNRAPGDQNTVSVQVGWKSVASGLVAKWRFP